MPNTWLDQAIVNIYNTGFFDYALPFMVTFAIVYGILEKTKLLGKENARLNAIFALVVSMIVMPFAAGVDFYSFISKLAFVIVKFVAIAILLGLLGYKFGEHKKTAMFLALFFITAIVVTEFFDIGSLQDLLSLNANLIYALIVIFMFGFIFWLIIRPSKEVPVSEVKETKKQEKPETRPREEEAEPPRRQRIPASELERQLGIEIDKEK